MRRRRRVLRAAIVLACGLAGCAAPPAAAPEAPPPDFALSVTVLPTVQGLAPGEFEPARYILDASGELRAAVGEAVSTRTHPGFSRRVSEAQRAALYRATLATGVLDSTPGANPRHAGSEAAAEDRRAAPMILWATASLSETGDDNARGATLLADPARDPAARELLALLEELAWRRPPADPAPEPAASEPATPAP